MPAIKQHCRYLPCPNAWLRHPRDFRSAVLDVIRCGGDTDTLAAITGAIVGAGVSEMGIPAEWVRGMAEWPRTLEWIKQLGARLAEVCRDGQPRKALPLSIPGLLMRNLLFVLVVLVHGLRRLLPPY